MCVYITDEKIGKPLARTPPDPTSSLLKLEFIYCGLFQSDAGSDIPSQSSPAFDRYLQKTSENVLFHVVNSYQ